MKTYIFLTNLLGGYFGGPSYVLNKKMWLEQHGWKVIAFDTTGHNKRPINYNEFNEYKNNRIEELFYHPSWYNKKTRNHVINIIISKCPKESNEIVIESNTTILAEWGEIIAERINAKHLIYLIAENVKISNINEFNFLYHKYKNNELFSISAKAFQSLWGDYIKVEDANMHYWNAMSITQPQDVKSTDLDSVKNADITITHFGRFKEYVPDVIKELCLFAENHNDKTINVIFFGIKSLSSLYTQQLEQNNNIHLYLFDSTFPIPQKIFQISDVVIATAGCASISIRQGTKTVSYNVETNLPLGVMRYTTVQSSFSDPRKEDINQPLNKILDDILINKIYNCPEPLGLPVYEKGYEYHISFVNNKKHYYKNILKIDYYKTINGLIQRILCKIGLVHIASLMRYLRYK